MSRYRGPRLRVVRRLGKLISFTNKSSLKTNPPGQHGASSSKKLSQYAIRLKEKQKLRFYYGISEAQLLNYLKKARKKKGSSGRELLILLEMRLDNIVFRLGLAPTIIAARQLVVHGHVYVDNCLVNIPSFFCRPSTIITVKNFSSSQALVRTNLEKNSNNLLPSHLVLNRDKIEAKVVDLVDRNSISLLVNELLVVEYYSRKL